jgi:hypothetical protein
MALSLRALRQLTTASNRTLVCRLSTRARPSRTLSLLVRPQTQAAAIRGFSVSARRFGEGTSKCFVVVSCEQLGWDADCLV